MTETQDTGKFDNQPPEVPITNWYKTQSEINAEMLLELKIELLAMHSKIDLILEAIKK